MANPEGRVVMEEAEAQQAAERYAKMEENLQALRQQNEELLRALGEQQDLVAAERLRADRRARAQMQEFANLTAEMLAGRGGPAVQFDGARMNVKVEKPEQYDGDKSRDLDTWLFQVREHLNLSTVPARGHVPYAASLLRGNAACGGGRFVKRIGDLRRGTTSAGSYGHNSDQRTMGAEDATTWRQCGNTRGKVLRILCSASAQHVSRCQISPKQKNWTVLSAHWRKTSDCRLNYAGQQTFTRRRCLPNAPTQLLRTSLATMHAKLCLRSKNGATSTVHLHRRETVEMPVRQEVEGRNQWSLELPVAGR